MTTFKRNHLFYVPKKNNDSQPIPRFMFENVLSHNQIQYLNEDHKGLIEEIKSKNTLLAKFENTQNTESLKNLPTPCQKYANILCQKYGLASWKKQKQQKSIQYPVKFLSEQEQIFRGVFIGKQFLHEHKQYFQYSVGEIQIKIQQLSNYLSSKSKSLQENDRQIDEQIKYLQLFTLKINNRLIKSQTPPFFLSTIKMKSQTPDKIKEKSKIKKKDQNENEKYSILIQEQKSSNSSMITESTPNLLSDFQQKENDQSNLLMSFNPNIESSSNCFSTLKYSESQLKLGLSKHQKDSQTVNKLQESESMPFSPVQPYRLHKLQAESESSKHANITGRLGQFLNSQDLFIISVTDQIISQIKNSTKKQQDLSNNILSIYSQSVDEISKSIEKNHTSIKQENNLIEEEWSQISIFIQKDMQQLADLIELQKRQNDTKDKKFLQNLDLIQNQLIEDIFAEKQTRKMEEKLLTQVLTNLVDSFQTRT